MEIRLTEEVRNFIVELDLKAETKVKKRLAMLLEHGHTLRMPQSRHILPSIFELRMIGKDNIRLIYTFKHNEAIVFHAYIKKTEEISRREMNTIRQKFNSLIL